MKILISVVSASEAVLCAACEPDILDIKNPLEGSLGAHEPDVLRAVSAQPATTSVELSATLGDLPFLPSTAALAAFGAAQFPIDYLKAGLYGPQTPREGAAMLQAIERGVGSSRYQPRVVAVGYADYNQFGGMPPLGLVHAAVESGVSIVMLDTAFKNGQSLFDVIDSSELHKFVNRARSNQLQVALAGALDTVHLNQLQDLAPDIIGVRSAVCHHSNRNDSIDMHRTNAFLSQVRSMHSMSEEM